MVGQTGGRWVISKYAGSLALDGDPIILYFMVTKTGVCNCLLNGTYRPKESSMSSNTISISLFKSSTVAVPFLGVFCNLCNFIFHEYSVCEHSVTLIARLTSASSRPAKQLEKRLTLRACAWVHLSARFEIFHIVGGQSDSPFSWNAWQNNYTMLP